MAFGLIFSMFFTLLVIPVLFTVVKSRTVKQATVAVVVAACALLAGGREASAEPVKHALTLPQAVELALKQNSVLKIARTKVEENDQKIVSARSQYFPQLSNDTKYMALSDRQLITIPTGVWVTSLEPPSRTKR
jgi:outer membrane protein TolC